jgi:LysM repeat protein
MNRWLKLAISGMAAVVIAITGVAPPGGAPPAAANEVTPTITVAATNNTTTVGADANGVLYWSTNAGSTWSTSGTTLSDHGVTSIVWNGTHFVASSFFQGATSTNGRSWSTFLLPVGSAYDPGDLISDKEFFSSGTMSVDQIQAFLNGKVLECRSGFVCMKDYRETTYSRDSTVLCKKYKGAENEAAAQILFKVSNACGVSVQALLVLIQKEQSLVTHTWPSQGRFDKATGYACPDTAPCDERFFGFYNQVYNAARQFKRYSNPVGTSRFFTWYPIGQVSQVRFHPNASCGAVPVRMKNQATAGLYYYTPYTPNVPAMTNVTGTGDSCSAYGNRNFWRIYNFWFKKPEAYRTMLTSSKGVTMAIDQEGGVTISPDLRTWTRPSVVPTVSRTNPVLEFGRTRDGDFAVLTQAGTAFQSEDAGRSWKTLAVTRADREETTTAVHVVQAGDTVALIADIHGITVAALVEQNLLGDNGDSLTPGQELTITRKTVVNGLVSPVIPDPSMIRVSAPAEPEAPTEPTPPAPEPVAPTPPAPIPPPIAPSQPGVTEYVVKAGDTLLRIARAHQTTVASLVSINGITNPNRIFVGQRLRLQPGPSATPAPTTPGSSAFPPLEPLVVRNAAKETTYVVKRGDSLLSIARAHDTTVSALVSLNSISNPNRIFVGQKLKIRSSNGQTRSFHRVQAGDTLPIIGQRRSIDVSELIRLNPKVPTSGDLKDGSLIRVS